MASCVVATGQVVGHRGQTRTRTDCAAPLVPVVTQLPDLHRDDGVVENRTTPWSLDGCRVVAQWCQGPWVAKDWRQGRPRRAFLRAPTQTPGFHFPPNQGAWLHQVAWWVRVFARRFLKRGACCAVPDVATRLDAYLEVYNTPQAPPYRWT
jgi:hypothetical protein